MKQIHKIMRQQKISKLLRDKFGKSVKKAKKKKIFMHKNSSHLLETQGKHISY